MNEGRTKHVPLPVPLPLPSFPVCLCANMGDATGTQISGWGGTRADPSHSRTVLSQGDPHPHAPLYARGECRVARKGAYPALSPVTSAQSNRTANATPSAASL